jgi:serine/threonine protein kinase
MTGAQGSGRTLGAYQIGARLGAGPVGDVWRALAPGNREMAVKVLRAPFVNSPAIRQRFLAISATVAQLDHPHILPIEASGEQGAQVFVAMPFVAQGSLAGRFAGGRLSPKDIAPLFNQICDALNYIFSQGMTHGNLKPANVLLFEGKHCLLSDFGQLWQVAETDLTQSGVRAEAVLYMPPEQMEGYVDIRNDIYSVGAMLFHALTGMPPYPGQTPFEVLSRHQRQPVPSLAAVTPPLASGALVFEDVIRMALAKDPNARFQTPVALARAIVEAGNLANDLPSRAVPIITPGMPNPLTPQMPPAMPHRPPPGTNAAAGPMPGQMIPHSRPLPGQMPPSYPPPAPMFGPAPGQAPPAMPPPQQPISRPRVPSQPLPNQAPPPPPYSAPPPMNGMPPQAPPDDPLSWLFADNKQGMPPARPTPAPPPNLDAADFLTARHSAPDPSPRGSEMDETGRLPPPTMETDLIRRPPEQRWDRDGYDEYDERDYTGGQSMVSPREWDEDSRSMSVPSMRMPARPPSRDRWEESDDRYRPRADDDYSQEMASARVSARGRPPEYSQQMYAPYDDGRSMQAPAVDPTRQSVVIPAPKRRRGRSRLPLILGIVIVLALLANIGAISVLAPQRCPAHLCDGLNAKLAPLFGRQAVPTLSLTQIDTKTSLTAAVDNTATFSDVLALSGNETSALGWQATADLGWVTLTPPNGTLAPGQTVTIGVVLAPAASVTPGNYTATVTLTAGGATAQVKLTLTVKPPAGG